MAYRILLHAMYLPMSRNVTLRGPKFYITASQNLKYDYMYLQMYATDVLKMAAVYF